MTDIDTLKRAAELLRSLDHVEIDATDLATALESLAERMGQEPVAWLVTEGEATMNRVFLHIKSAERAQSVTRGSRIVPLYAATQPTLDIPAGLQKTTSSPAAAEISGAATQDDCRDREIQGLRGAAARYRIELRLVQELLDDPGYEPVGPAMEYWSSMHDRIRQLQRDAAPQPTPEDVRDAARYRWLRKHCSYYGTEISFGSGFNQQLPEGVDAAIDAAMQQEQAK